MEHHRAEDEQKVISEQSPLTIGLCVALAGVTFGGGWWASRSDIRADGFTVAIADIQKDRTERRKEILDEMKVIKQDMKDGFKELKEEIRNKGK